MGVSYYIFGLPEPLAGRQDIEVPEGLRSLGDPTRVARLLRGVAGVQGEGPRLRLGHIELRVVPDDPVVVVADRCWVWELEPIVRALSGCGPLAVYCHEEDRWWGPEGLGVRASSPVRFELPRLDAASRLPGFDDARWCVEVSHGRALGWGLLAARSVLFWAEHRLLVADRDTATDGWAREFAQPLVAVCPLGDAVVGLTVDGAVEAFDERTGGLRWRTSLGAPGRSLASGDGWVAVGCDDGVRILGASTGEAWGTPEARAVGTVPAVPPMRPLERGRPTRFGSDRQLAWVPGEVRGAVRLVEVSGDSQAVVRSSGDVAAVIPAFLPSRMGAWVSLCAHGDGVLVGWGESWMLLEARSRR